MAAPMSKCANLAAKVYRSSKLLHRDVRWIYAAQRHASQYGLSGDTIRIGCASGFWGDTAVAAPQLIHHGNLDYLVMDYLSEITMSLMTAAKNKVPDMGYAPDFVQVAVGPYLKAIKKKGVKVISNAGGVNLPACVAALQQAASKAGVELNVAAVTGDDLMPQKSALEAAGVCEMDSGLSFPPTVNSMNAYLGAGPIARALELGADIVVTGRCADSSLVLGPLMHKFSWGPRELDLLASGSLAGHLIECGAQATGGIFTDWHKVNNWENMGFPIVECASNGEFVLTKPPKTGGLVSTATASEQLVYEIGDPSSYILPDVVCDFANVQIQEISGQEGEAVHVTGARGKPATDTYKVCATYLDGYRTTAVAGIGGPRAADKGRKTADAILKRTKGIFKQLGISDFTRTHLQVLGAEDTYGPHATPGQGPREAILWMAVQHTDKRALQIFSREIAPAGTGMAPGLTGIVGGRPKVSPVLKLFSFLHPKDNVKVEIHMNGEFAEEYTAPKTPAGGAGEAPTGSTNQAATLPSGTHSYRLEDLAYTRSGDKGNNCNIGVVARHPALLPYIRQALTPEGVAEYFAHVFEDQDASVGDKVQRYDLPGIHGLNFVLRNSLGGGGVASLRSDPQGKAYGQMLLDFKVENMPDLKDLTKE